MPEMKQLPRYKCHKEVWALKVREIEHKPNPSDGDSIQCFAPSYGAFLHFDNQEFPAVEVPADWVIRHKPIAGGYYVQYADGYTSFSPAEAFESGYQRIETFQDRLLVERQELEAKLGKLIAFIRLDDRHRLGPQDRELLDQQAKHMSDYLAVLDKRIAKILG